MKRIFCFVLLAIILSNIAVINAQEDTVLPGESVYASPEKQEEIAERLRNNEIAVKELAKLESCILTESITPVYCIDPVEVINTGKWNLYPSKICYPSPLWSYLVAGELGDEPEMYVAKAINYRGINSYDVSIKVKKDEDYVWFNVIGDKIEYGGWSRTSYADHIQRTHKSLSHAGFDEAFSSKDVRYVIILGIDAPEDYGVRFDYGSAFFVSKNGKEGLVNLNAYDGLFYGKKERPELINATDAEALSGDKLMQRFRELKEKRDVELSYISISEKMGVGIGDIDNHFCKQYRENKGSNYKNAYMIHVLHISDYMKRGEFIMMTYYPKADKLIGTRYAALETDKEEVKTTMAGEETVLGAESVDHSTPQKNETTTATYVVLAVVALCVLAVGAVAFVVKKR